MTSREYRDAIREQWIQNPDTCPSRTITYVSSSLSIPIVLEAFTSGLYFDHSLPDDKKVNASVFSGIKLPVEPTVTDIVVHDGKPYSVREWKLVGTLWTVFTENAKRNKVTSRKFT